MAEAAAEDIYEQLKDVITCSICLEQVTCPKVLTCHHTFCLHCIQVSYDEVIKKRPCDAGQVCCPFCKAVTPVRGNDLSNLPSDFRVNKLEAIMKKMKTVDEDDKDLEVAKTHCAICCKQGIKVDANAFCFNCSLAICDHCLKAHQTNRHTNTHAFSQVNKEDFSSIICSAHKEYYRAYCVDCLKPVCQDCILVTHSTHRIKELECKTETESQQLKAIKKQEMEMNKSLEMIKHAKRVQTGHVNSAKATIHQEKLRLLKELDHREQALYAKIDQDDIEVNKILTIMSNKANGKKDALQNIATTIQHIETPVLHAPGVTLVDSQSYANALSQNIPLCTLKIPNCHKYKFSPWKLTFGDLTIQKTEICLPDGPKKSNNPLGAGSYKPAHVQNGHATTNQASNQYFPKTGFQGFDQATPKAILGKLREFNNQADPQNQITEEQVVALGSLMTGTPPESQLQQQLSRLLQWPAGVLFPVLDILRLAIRHPAINTHFCNDKDGPMFINYLLTSLSQGAPDANQMLVLRTLANTFYNDPGKRLLLDKRDSIIAGLMKCKDNSNKNVQTALSTVLLNYAVSFQGSNDIEAKSQCLSAGVTVSDTQRDPEANFRLLVCIGTLVTGDKLSTDLAKALGVQQFINKCKALTQPSKVLDCARVLEECLK